MQLYSETKEYKLYSWNMLDMLENIGGGTIDSIVTDPPYELNFMWKWWDNSWIAFQADTWKKCYEVLKPWWYLLAFWGSRTFHRIACAIEDAGFEIRDTIMWLYGSWFPKSLNIWLAIDKKNWVESEVVWEWKSWVSSRAYQSEETTTAWWYEIKKASNEWNWWGTALKPSYEPIIVARKPLEWSCTDNVIKYGVGGINIDECRIWFVNDEDYKITANKNQHEKFWTKPITNNNVYWDYSMIQPKNYQADGRFPANTILTYDEEDFNEVCGGFPTNCWNWHLPKTKVSWYWEFGGWKSEYIGPWEHDVKWNACRYFYCAKASKRDRDEGLDEMETKSHAEINGRKEWSAGAERAYWWWTNPYLSVSSPRKNTHPTVKPTDLMQYLVRLVTPNWWTVLDPFNWSGSTWKAVMYENKDRHKNYKYIWIELTDEYLPIAKARIEYVINWGVKVEEEKKPEVADTTEWQEQSLF